MKCEERPLISVIIPVYNGEKFIEKAITSVLAQGENVEVLIIDDGSCDKTEVLCKPIIEKNPNVVFWFKNEKNIGVAESRNIGIRKAKGEYIAFLDADDYWREGKLSAQIKALEESGAVLCGTGRELISEEGESLGKFIGVPERVTFEDLLKTNYLSCSSVLALSGPVKEFEMCRPDLHEDYILWLRILKKYGAAVGINEPYLKSRMAKGGKSRNKLKSAKMHYGSLRFIGLSPLKAAFKFVSYAVHGVLKYS